MMLLVDESNKNVDLYKYFSLCPKIYWAGSFRKIRYPAQ